MIQLIFWGIVAAVALGAIYGLDSSRQKVGERRIEAKYAPIAEQCTTMQAKTPADCAAAIRAEIEGRKVCVAANKSLDDQFSTFRAMHNDSIASQNAEFEKIRARKAQSVAAVAPKLADIAIEKFNYIAAAKAAGLSCEQFDAAALEEAKRRQRDYGAATATQPSPATSGSVKIVTPPERPTNPLRKAP